MTVETFGCDFAFTKPDPGALERAGYTFVIGYVSADPSKDLSGAQLAAYLSAGLKVALVFETTADRALSGASGGKNDGAIAESAANSRGYPLNAPIFYAIDFPAGPSDMPTLAAYGGAFNLATRRPVGPYGDFAAIEALVTPGAQPNQVGWQTAAWSNGLLSQKANVYQRATHNHPLVVPANQFDEDVICKPITLAGGVLNPGGNPAPTPPPPPQPIYYRVVSGDNLTVIANRFHTTVSNIVAWNRLSDPNRIYPGENLIVGWR